MAARRSEGARELLQERWAQIFPFDLADETLDQLLAEHQPGTLLEAIKLARDVRDHDVAKAYQYFLKKLAHVASKYEPRAIQN